MSDRPRRDVCDTLMEAAHRNLIEGLNRHQQASEALVRATAEKLETGSALLLLNEEFFNMGRKYKKAFGESWKGAGE